MRFSEYEWFPITVMNSIKFHLHTSKNKPKLYEMSENLITRKSYVTNKYNILYLEKAIMWIGVKPGLIKEKKCTNY